ncbi:hypothetical protein K402DRAFT_460895 [Aulographum hederae CBS 113979]|uniref:Uncharacterized protein n=1 Tax=Aulographum hederae CBS 113979 TaxID=1176131 RepID=A0A6G1H951_9PEZI|nr:hypothetical protein K402DRAFT_460895 [Aulographum hederae CBS 113979]
MSTTPSLTGPGLIYATSRDLSTPSNIKSIPIAFSAHYKCKDAAEEQKKYLGLYHMQDLRVLGVGVRERLEGAIGVLGKDVDVRAYREIQVYGRDGNDVPHTIISASMQPTPAGGPDLDAWYRDEHNEQMSRERGYVRTRRYRLVHQIKPQGATECSDAPEWLGLHEFEEENPWGDTVVPLDPMSEWTKKVMAAQERIEAGMYVKVSGEDV